jgi:hypothetical protein
LTLARARRHFTKEMGVFANPTSKASPAKLRVAFEVGLACECHVGSRKS